MEVVCPLPWVCSILFVSYWSSCLLWLQSIIAPMSVPCFLICLFQERLNQCQVPGRVQVPLSGGNVLSIPVEKVKFEPDTRTINISDEMSKCGVWKFIAENSETHTVPKHHHKEWVKCHSSSWPQISILNIPVKSEAVGKAFLWSVVTNDGSLSKI